MYRTREEVEMELVKWRTIAAIALLFAMFFAGMTLAYNRARVWMRVTELARGTAAPAAAEQEAGR